MMKLLIFGWHGKFRLFIMKILISLNYVLLIFFGPSKIKQNVMCKYALFFLFCLKLIKIRLKEVHT